MIHDSDSIVRSSCRENDESMFMVMAAKQIEVLKAAWWGGQYVERQRAALQSANQTPEQKAWLEAHIKEHEQWFTESMRLLEAERDARGKKAMELAEVKNAI